MTTTALLTAPVLPDLDTAIDGEALGDDILLSAAGAEKVQRVRRVGNATRTDHNPRAWTFRGNVD